MTVWGFVFPMHFHDNSVKLCDPYTTRARQVNITEINLAKGNKKDTFQPGCDNTDYLLDSSFGIFLTHFPGR